MVFRYLFSALLLAGLECEAADCGAVSNGSYRVEVLASAPDKGDAEKQLDDLAKSNQWRDFANVMDRYLKKYGYPGDTRFYDWMLNLKVSNIDRPVSKKAVRWIEARMEAIRVSLAETDETVLPKTKRSRLENYMDSYGRIVKALQ